MASWWWWPWGEQTDADVGNTDVGSVQTPCKKWRIQLIDENDNAIAGVKFSVDNNESKLNDNGMSEEYTTPCPGEGIEEFQMKYGLKFSLKVLPDFRSLKDHYDVRDKNAFATAVGGEIPEWAGKLRDSFNTCTLRVSQAFNYSTDAALYYKRDLEGQGRGLGIPRGELSMGTLKRWKGGDGKAYAAIVTEFIKYMDHYYPTPDTKKIPAPDAASINGLFGIIGFFFPYTNSGVGAEGAEGAGGGGGHFTLWDRNRALYNENFGKGVSYLWVCMEITYVRKLESNDVDTYVFRHAPKK